MKKRKNKLNFEHNKSENPKQKTIFSAILEYLWLICIALVPLLIIPDFSVNTLKFSVFGILIFLMLFFWIINWIKTKKIDFSFDNFIKVLFALFIVIIIAAVFSKFPIVSFWGGNDKLGLITIFYLFILFIILITSVNKNFQIQKIINTLLFSSLIMCLIALLQYFKIIPAIYLEESQKFYQNSAEIKKLFISSTFADSLQFIIFNLMLVPLTIYKIINNKKIVYWIILVFQLVILFLNIYPQIILTLFLTMVFLFLLIGIFKRKIWLFILSIIGLISISIFLLSANTTNFLKISSNSFWGNYNFSSKNSELNLTYRIWQLSILPIKDNLIIGVGPDGVMTMFNSKDYFDKVISVKFSENALDKITNVNNIYLNMLLSFGIIGLLLFLIIIYIQFKSVLKSIKINSKNTLTYSFAISLFIFLVSGIFTTFSISIYVFLVILLSLIYILFIKQNAKERN